MMGSKTEQQLRQELAGLWALLDAERDGHAALRKDAERYRWLRHGDNDDRCIRLTSHGDPYMLRGGLLDGAIDEAMAADAEQEGHTVAVPAVG